MKSGGSLSAPFLKRITLLPERAERGVFPFNTFPRLYGEEFLLEFENPVTFFVGENGTGKSTLLEAIAALCGFHSGGGGAWHQLHRTADDGPSALAAALRPSRLPKVSDGYFFRADTFAEIAGYLDDAGVSRTDDGRGLLQLSHGESFLAVFTERFETTARCIFLMDESENALSPMRRLSFLSLLHRWAGSGNAQMIIATHSPILLSYPGAKILHFDGGQIAPIAYEDIEHVQVTKAFLGNPARYHRALFDDESGG